MSLRQILTLVILCGMFCLMTLAEQKAQITNQSSPSSHSESVALALGKPIEQKIAEGQTHSYRLPLNAGKFVPISIRQLGVNVAATLYAPAVQQAHLSMGKPISRNGLFSTSNFQAQDNSTIKLEPGKSINRAIKKGEVHRFEMDLQAGDYAHIVIGQQGVGIDFSFLGASGEKLFAVKNLTSSEEIEWISYIASAPGKYTIEFVTDVKLGVATPYEIQLRERRKATADDEKRVAAAKAMFDAAQLSEAKKPDTYLKAIEKRNEALNLFASLAMREEEAVAYNQIGWTSTSLYEYAAAQGYHNKALAIYLELKNRRGEAITLRALAATNYYLNRMEKMIAYAEQSLEAWKAIGARRREAGALYLLGVAYERIRQYDKAINFCERALPIYGEVKDREGEGNTCNVLGNIYNSLNNYPKAIENYEQAVRIARELENKSDEATAVNNLASVFLDSGQVEKAIEYYNRGLSLSREEKDKQNQGYTLNGLGNAFNGLKQYEKALDYFQQALAVRQEIKDRRNEGTTLANIALAYRNLKQYEKALEFYNVALSVRRELQSKSDEASDLNGIANVYGDLKNYEKAIEFYNQALVAYREAGDRSGEGYALSNLGSTYRNMKEYEKALNYYNQALAIRREIKERKNEAYTLNDLGNVYADLTNYEKAIGFYHQSLAAYQEVNDRSNQGYVLYNLGNNYRNLKEYDKALEFYTKTLTIRRELKERGNEADSLNSIGIVYDDLKNYEKAIEFYNQALVAYREAADKSGEGYVLNNLGVTYQNLKEYEKASDYFNQALAIRRKLSETEKEADTLYSLGYLTYNQERGQQALEYYRQALALYRSTQNLKGTAKVFDGIGDVYKIVLTQYANSITYYEQALAEKQRINDHQGMANTLYATGSAYYLLDKEETAIDYYEKSLGIFQSLRNKVGQGSVFQSLGDAYRYLHDRSVFDAGKLSLFLDPALATVDLFDSTNHYINLSKAAACYEQALLIARESKDREKEAGLLALMAELFKEPKLYDRAIFYLNGALEIYKELKNRSQEAKIYTELVRWHNSKKEYNKALEYSTRAQALYKELKDRKGELQSIKLMASSYSRNGKSRVAISYQEQALQLSRELKDKAEEANILNDLGLEYRYIALYEKAKSASEQSLAIRRELGDRKMEEQSLNNLGLLYSDLGQYDKAIEIYEQCIKLNTALRARREEGYNLTNTANAYEALKNYEKAIEKLLEAANIFQDVYTCNCKGRTYSSLGSVYSELKQYDTSLNYYTLALGVSRELGDREAEVSILRGIGKVYREQKQFDGALDYLEQSLALAKEIDSADGERSALEEIMYYWKDRSTPSLATFYGKQAVNIIQNIREGNKSLSGDLRKSFLKKNETLYRELANLLITDGRLPEAEQVLAMLKEDEFFNFVRRNGNDAASNMGDIEYNKEEEPWQKRYREISDRIVQVGQEFATLNAKASRTAQEDNTLLALQSDLDVVRQSFNAFFKQLSAELGKANAKQEKLVDLKSYQNFQKTLEVLGPNVVALYTLVGETKYRVILVTPQIYIDESFDISAEELNKKVLAFRAAIQNPKLDPTVQAQELYKILIGDRMAKHLADAKAETIMWSLDGVLRYLPVVALHDGKQYLVEKYRNVVFTLASREFLKDQPSPKWRAAGFGMTKEVVKNDGTFPALKGVREELNGIIHSENQGGTAGVLQGNKRFDEEFDEKAFRLALLQKYQVLHIASHFNFKPGEVEKSYLLLGDGGELSLAKIGVMDFQNVELLTLSACETAMGGGGDGKEIEGFGMLAQAQGAKAVMATLWAVEDRSTSLLMQEFYKQREANKGMTKAEALRQAQLALLRGSTPATDTTGGNRAKEVATTDDKDNRKLFQGDAKAPHKHPYYWAPFILIGNWK
jgi:tetratricopeptide (TPR) repeat protein